MQASIRVSPSPPSSSTTATATSRRSASPASSSRLPVVDEPIEWLPLIAICLYHVLLILLTRYSLGYLRESYSLPVLITQIEGWKFIISAAWIWITGASMTDIFTTIWQYCSYRWIVSGTFIAIISGFQFLALKHLPAFTFIVGQSLTLVCMFIFNGLLPSSTTSSRLDNLNGSSSSIFNARKLKLSLILLLGCLILYHDPPTEGNLLNQSIDATTMTRSNHIGYAALLIMCLLEGYAQVYVDRTGVNHPTPSTSPVNLTATSSPTSPTQQPRRLSIWERNLILAFWGMIVSFILLCIAEWSSNRNSSAGSASDPSSDPASSSSSLFSHPLIHGMSLWSSGIVLFQSGGSLLLSANLRRMSSRLQNYATVTSICLISVSSLFLLSLHSTAESLCGSGIVSIAVWSWNDESSLNESKKSDVELDPFERRGLLSSPSPPAAQDEEHGIEEH